MEQLDIDIYDDSFDVDEEFSNNTGGAKTGGGSKLDPNALMTALGGVATMVGSFGAGKRAKEQGKADAKNYASQLALAKEQNKALATQTEMMRIGASQTPPPPQGMSTGAKIGIAVGGIIFLVGGYLLYKRSRG